MCEQMHDATPCLNYKCSHNLFWEGLRLDVGKIQMTEKAFRIKSCCCLIHESWTPEEIATAWGLTPKRVRQAEGWAWRKVQRKCNSKQSGQPIQMAQNRVTMGRKEMCTRKRMPPAKQPLFDGLRVE